MKGAHSSAGVYSYTDDRSARVSATSPSIGAIVGPARKGKVNQRVLVADGDDFTLEFGKQDASLTFMHHCARAFLTEGSQLYVTRIAVGAKYGGVLIKKVGNFSEVVDLPVGQDDPDTYVFQDDDIMLITAENPGVWNNGLSILIYPDVNDIQNRQFVLQVFEQPSSVALETYRGILAYDTDGYGVQLNIEELTESSDIIRVRVNTAHPELIVRPDKPLVNTLSSGQMVNGHDGDAITDGDIINAWDLYEDPEEIDVNLLINGGYTNVGVQQKMDEIASGRGDAIAILDVPSHLQDTQDAVNYRRNIVNIDSSFSAMYTPDLYVADADNGLKLFVPPSGHVAAAYARTDQDAELWFAPAGLQRGVLNVLKTRNLYKLGLRDALADSQINVIRNIKGNGIVIWGADTMQFLPSAFSNVNVQRLVSHLQKNISLSALVGVYEPNDPQLWAQLVSICERFLNPIKRGRGLYWFDVVCDERNNKPDTIAAGDTMLDVYIDPVLPAKRIHITAVIPPTGAISFAQELLN